MRKVCILTTVHHAYDGRIYYKQCKSLRKAGYDVMLIAPAPEKYEDDEIPIIPITKPKSKWRRMLHTFKVISLARKTNADIYHFHDPELVPVGVILRFLTKKPVIYDVHEHYPNAIMSKQYLSKPMKIILRTIYECVEKVSLPILSGVIYTTSIIGKRYEKLNSCQIENYPPREIFKHISHFSSAKNPNQLIYLGGITKIRGVNQLILGFAEVAKNNSKARLMFVGFFESSEYEKEIHDLINKLSLSTNIEFIGKVPYQEIEKYLAKSSIGIIPYLPVPNHLVCMPNKMFEYMASGNAVIASDFEHYREVIKESQCGITVNPNKPSDIAKAINKLVRDEQVLFSMQENGQAAFATKYNWETEEKKLLQYYQQLLS